MISNKGIFALGCIEYLIHALDIKEDKSLIKIFLYRVSVLWGI